MHGDGLHYVIVYDVVLFGFGKFSVNHVGHDDFYGRCVLVNRHAEINGAVSVYVRFEGDNVKLLC